LVEFYVLVIFNEFFNSFSVKISHSDRALEVQNKQKVMEEEITEIEDNS